jgi:hypothetical protein
MLEGFDVAWSDNTQDFSANYTNLDPGKYVFKIMACNSDGYWTKAPTGFAFEIKKPFWKTWWYYVSEISFFILLILIAFYINKTNKESKAAAILTFMVIILIFEFINVSIDPYTTNIQMVYPCLNSY